MNALLRALLLAIIFCAPAYAQTPKTKTQLNSEIDANFPSNTSGAITPLILRTVTKDMVASWTDYLTCTTQGGIIYWGAAAAPACLLPGVAGQFLMTNGIAANPQWGTNLVYIPNATSATHEGFWITDNAFWDGSHWQRVDITKYALAINVRAIANLPGEASTSGTSFWRAQPGANPISDTYGAVGGWETQAIFTNFKDAVLGGFCMELDGQGTIPYARFCNSNNSGNNYRGTLTNLFGDFSGVDTTGSPSWFHGIFNDSFCVQRAPTGGSIALVNRFCVDSSGNSLNIAGERNTGYSLQVPVNGFAITIGNNLVSLILDPAGILATGAITMPSAPSDGQIISVITTFQVTALTVSPNSGQSIKGAPATLDSGNRFGCQYVASNTTWYC